MDTAPALELWFIALDEVEPSVLARALGDSATSVAGLRSIDPGSDVDERRRIIAHAAVRLLLVRWVGEEVAFRPFARGFAGKPCIDPQPDRRRVEFSLSHTGAVALVGIAVGGAIGVDIEQPRRVSMSAERRAQILQAGAQIASTPLPVPGLSDAALLSAWVRLEAYAKATGDGMGRLLTRFGIVGTKQDSKAMSAVIAAEAPLSIRDLKLPEPYVGALASSVPSDAVEVTRFPIREAALQRLMAIQPLG